MPPDDALGRALSAVVEWFSAARVPYAIIEGLAVSLQAAPRFTEDIDAVLWVGDRRWPELIVTAASFSVVPMRPDVLEFAARTRVLLLRHASGVRFDVSCGARDVGDRGAVRSHGARAVLTRAAGP